VEWNATWENHQIFVVVLPQSENHLGHEFQYAARALKAFNGGPVFIEAIKNLGMDWVSLD
jgi:hypothetical protein